MGKLTDSGGKMTAAFVARMVLKRSLLSLVITGTAWRQCSGALHGASGLIRSDVIHFSPSLFHSFCTTEVRTVLPLLPLPTAAVGQIQLTSLK